MEVDYISNKVAEALRATDYDFRYDGYYAIGTRAFMNVNQLTLWNIQKWLRDKHHCVVEVTLDIFTNCINWNYQILFYDPKTFEMLYKSTYKCGGISDYTTYENALDTGIEHACKILNNN